MKTENHYFAIVLLALSFIAFGNVAYAQVPEGTKMIIVRVYESPSPMINSHIVIAYGNNKSETVELDPDTKKNAPDNLDKVNKVFTRIEGEGFELITATAILTYGANATTYVFRKSK